MFSQVLNQIRLNHPDSIALHDLFMAAIEGMIGAVDPHSYVLPAHRLSPDRERDLRAGRLHTVPLQFGYYGLAPVVVSIDDAARAAGLDVLPGDELISIDGQVVRSRSSSELEIELAGARGSTVMLGFERQRLDGSVGTITRAVTRGRGEERTGVAAALMVDDRTGYLRIAHFLDDNVADEARSAIASLEKQGATRLLLDLRGNAGGDPAQAGRIAGEFLPRGTVVYSVDSRHEKLKRTVKVERSFLRPGGRQLPVVVMVDQGTASAAELLAAALQDHDRAVVVGRPTFGKALIMQALPLSDGSMVMLVVGTLTTPCGRTIQREYRGLPPREYYRMSARERETAGLPSCMSAGGRVLHGTDGVRPDILFDRPPAAPGWLSAIHEQQIADRWAAAFVAENTSPLPALEMLTSVPVLDASVLRSFTQFAGAHVELPRDAESLLNPVLVRALATAVWGPAGFYRTSVLLDPQIAQALRAFDTTILPAPRSP